jgi:hypothetical protein
MSEIRGIGNDLYYYSLKVHSLPYYGLSLILNILRNINSKIDQNGTRNLSISMKGMHEDAEQSYSKSFYNIKKHNLY